ncbi:hypothetical protein M0802_013228 [Mischocyttarus mexicanus]|nr:hypothetical protein M0802_013230 [Mischocyttarus mexicanus]KAI4483891.1 hypothetical protein M0802_013228 [Mischocyttarus mexicanus]
MRLYLIFGLKFKNYDKKGVVTSTLTLMMMMMMMIIMMMVMMMMTKTSTAVVVEQEQWGRSESEFEYCLGSLVVGPVILNNRSCAKSVHQNHISSYWINEIKEEPVSSSFESFSV